MNSVELTSRFLNTEISSAKRSSVENIAPKWGQRAKKAEKRRGEFDYSESFPLLRWQLVS